MMAYLAPVTSPTPKPLISTFSRKTLFLVSARVCACASTDQEKHVHRRFVFHFYFLMCIEAWIYECLNIIYFISNPYDLSAIVCFPRVWGPVWLNFFCCFWMWWVCWTLMSMTTVHVPIKIFELWKPYLWNDIQLKYFDV